MSRCALVALTLLFPSLATAQAGLVARRVKVDLSLPDPDAACWKGQPEVTVSLLGQPIAAPRPARTETTAITVQALHDGRRVAFRLRWRDPDRSEAGRLGAYSDAAALQFPARDGPLPPVTMGGPGQPVHLFHWRAQYQADAERGKPTSRQLYPNLSVDAYPMEFAAAPGGTPEQREVFAPALALGNPQAQAKSGVDEIRAEGFGSSAVQQGRGSAARARWSDGEWILVVSRPLSVEGGSVLRVGGTGHVAFAVWQGGAAEVGSRKSVTMSWTPLQIERERAP